MYGSLRKAAEQLGIHKNTLHDRVQKERLAEGKPEVAFTQQSEAAKMRNNKPTTIGYGIDSEIPEGLTLKSASIKFDKDGNPNGHTMSLKLAGAESSDLPCIPGPSKITKVSTYYDQDGGITGRWVQEKPEDIQREAMWREFAQALSEELPKIEPRDAPEKAWDDNLMTFIPFGDPHFGLHCWKDEVGQDFDLDIAKRDLCGAVKYLLSKAPNSRRCVIANLGDFFHADNLVGMTNKSGHILDLDTRMPRVIRVGVSAMRMAIESALAQHETVEVINAIGNHDEILAMALSIMLANIYENEPRVKIHDAPTRRHYIRHGKVLIGITHGDKTKDANLPLLMATECGPDWGITKHRYYYRGHHHHDSRVEYNGCIVEQVRTLTPGDAYAVGGGWLAGRDMKLIVHHAEYGEVSRTICSIDLLRSSMD